MKLSELAKRLKDGESLKSFESVFNLNVTTLQRKLKKVGFAFDNSTKVWSYGKGPELPEDLAEQDASNIFKSNNSNTNITKVKTQSNTDVKASNKKKSDSNTDSNINDVSITLEEYKVIQEMLTWYKGITGEEGLSLHERTKLLGDDTKTRKTFAISPETDKQITELANKERLQKSEILSLAVKDLYNKYHGK